MEMNNKIRDMIILIGKIAWNTRHEIEWVNLDSNIVETIVEKSIDVKGNN